MDVIRLVQGDEKPLVLLTLTDDISKTPLDLSSPTTTVSIKFKASGTNTVLSVIPCSKINGGAGGQVQFDFTDGVLDVDPGAYEGQIVVDYNGQTQTVYETIRFRVRDNF
jgi:hypothetical protein